MVEIFLVLGSGEKRDTEHRGCGGGALYTATRSYVSGRRREFLGSSCGGGFSGRERYRIQEDVLEGWESSLHTGKI